MAFNSEGKSQKGAGGKEKITFFFPSRTFLGVFWEKFSISPKKHPVPNSYD
jgi:hypothetical protein